MIWQFGSGTAPWARSLSRVPSLAAEVYQPDPFAFRVDRHPNEHFAFGIGLHYCLGANLARLELQEIFARIVRRLDDVELAGPLERMRSSFVGGVKRMPIRYRVTA